MLPIRAFAGIAVLLCVPVHVHAQVAGERTVARDVEMLRQLAASAGQGAVTVPPQLALEQWQTLDLSDAQVSTLRAINGRLVRALTELMAQAQEGPGQSLADVYWSSEPLDEDAFRRWQLRGDTIERRAAEALIRARDETYAALTPEQGARLRQLGRSSGPETFSASRSVMTHVCRDGSTGGSLRLDDAQVVYALSFEEDSARIRGLFIGRGAFDAGFPGPSERSRLPADAGRSSGGSMGRWMLRVSQDGRFWIDDRPVDVGGANVVLLEGIDRLREPPTVAGLVRVPSMIFTGGCVDRDLEAALRAHVGDVPEIRAFLERR